MEKKKRECILVDFECFCLSYKRWCFFKMSGPQRYCTPGFLALEEISIGGGKC